MSRGAGAASRPKTARWRSEDWVKHGQARLKAEGAAGLTLERLCETAGRTRGSFYHHFADMDGFLAALLTAWKDQQTDRLIETVRTAAADNGAGLTLLNALAGAIDHRLDVAVRQLAAVSPAAADAVADVDRRRIGYLAKLHADSDHKAEEPLALARLDYALFVGLQHLHRDAPAQNMADVYETLGRLIAEARP